MGCAEPSGPDPVRFRLGRFTLATNTVNLLVAVGFVIMGIAVIAQAGATEMTGADAPLVGMGAWLGEVFAWLLVVTAPIPEFVLGIALLTVVAVFVLVTLRDKTPGPKAVTSTGEGGNECCSTDSDGHHTEVPAGTATPKEPK